MSKATRLALIFAIICTWTVASIRADRYLQRGDVRISSQVDVDDWMSNAGQLPVQPATSLY
jgi:hypothetical protein